MAAEHDELEAGQRRLQLNSAASPRLQSRFGDSAARKKGKKEQLLHNILYIM